MLEDPLVTYLLAAVCFSRLDCTMLSDDSSVLTTVRAGGYRVE